MSTVQFGQDPTTHPCSWRIAGDDSGPVDWEVEVEHERRFGAIEEVRLTTRVGVLCGEAVVSDVSMTGPRSRRSTLTGIGLPKLAPAEEAT